MYIQKIGDNMKKELYEMPLDELWQLFPIVLTEHKSYWQSWFE